MNEAICALGLFAWVNQYTNSKKYFKNKMETNNMNLSSLGRTTESVNSKKKKKNDKKLHGYWSRLHQSYIVHM